MYLVGFNGPPHCGKDSVANKVIEICQHLGTPSIRASLAWPMRVVGMSLLGQNVFDGERYAELKESALPLFYGDTLRQFMINFSESFIKPKYGQDFFARCLINAVLQQRVASKNTVIFVPDVGFQIEPSYFESVLGEANVLIVQLAREGCNFAKDSRSYVGGSHNLGIENNGTLEDAAQRVYNKMIALGWPVVPF